MKSNGFIKFVTNKKSLFAFSLLSALDAFFFYACRANFVFLDIAVFNGIAWLLLSIMAINTIMLISFYVLVAKEVKVKEQLIVEKKAFKVFSAIGVILSILFSIGVIVNMIVAGQETIPVIFKMAYKNLPYFASVVAIIFLIAVYPNIKNVTFKKVIASIMFVCIFLVSLSMIIPFKVYKITSSPLVIDSGSDYYSVVFATSTEGTGYIEYEYDGKKYKTYDEVMGRIKGDSKIHTIKVPKEHLNNNTYNVGSKQVYEAFSYGSMLGTEVKSNNYNFKAPSGEKQTWLSVSDWHSRLNKAYKAVGYAGDYDGVIMLGDPAPGLMFEDEIKDYIVEFGGQISGGQKPVVYVRGNHETRGEYAAKLPSYLGMDNFYYTTSFGDYEFIVLDSGEDKVDSHPEYGSMDNYYEYRKNMTNWLENLPATSKKTITLVHSSEICIEKDLMKRSYDALKNIGVKQIVSGHTHSCEFFTEDGINVYLDGGIKHSKYIASKLTFDNGNMLIEAWDNNGAKVFNQSTII